MWCIHPPVGMMWLQNMLLTFPSLKFTCSNFRTVTCHSTVKSTAIQCPLFSRHIFFCYPIISIEAGFLNLWNSGFYLLFLSFYMFNGTEMQERKLLLSYNYNIILSLSKSKKPTHEFSSLTIKCLGTLRKYSWLLTSLPSCVWLYQ
jgi:hypothetical protein